MPAEQGRDGQDKGSTCRCEREKLRLNRQRKRGGKRNTHLKAMAQVRRSTKMHFCQPEPEKNSLIETYTTAVKVFPPPIITQSEQISSDVRALRIFTMSTCDSFTVTGLILSET